MRRQAFIAYQRQRQYSLNLVLHMSRAAFRVRLLSRRWVYERLQSLKDTVARSEPLARPELCKYVVARCATAGVTRSPIQRLLNVGAVHFSYNVMMMLLPNFGCCGVKKAAHRSQGVFN